MEKIIKNLNKFDKEYYLEINCFLRIVRLVNFYFFSSIDIRFNINMLSESEIDNFDFCINLCLELMRNKNEYLELVK